MNQELRNIAGRQIVLSDTPFFEPQPLSNGRISSDYSKYNDTYLMVTV